jgi:predicted dehydrogenase
VLEALSAGVHVIADKPVAPSAEAARDLAAVAADAGLRLGAYHQRRFDADLQTVRGLIEAGRLGEVWRFHSRFDLDEPHGLEPGPAGGLLRDLGSHLVDQVLWLFGPAIRVHAHLDHVELPAGRTDCGFVICIDHAGGTTSYLSASKLNHITSRTLRIYGSEGSYRATSCDVQARDIRRGRTPSQDAESWGYEPPQHWGQLDTGGGTQTIPSAQGRYQDYYTRFAEAVATGGPLPVEFEEAAAVLDVLDAARVSAAGQRVVTL